MNEGLTMLNILFAKQNAPWEIHLLPSLGFWHKSIMTNAAIFQKVYIYLLDSLPMLLFETSYLHWHDAIHDCWQ